MKQLGNRAKSALLSKGAGGAVIRGSIGTFAIKIAGAGLMFGMQVLFARLMGVEHFGDFTYVFSWMILGTVLTSCGFEKMLVRFIAKYRVTESWGEMLGLLGLSFRIVMVGSILLALLLGSALGWLGNERLSAPYHLFLAGFGLLLGHSLLKSTGGALRGFNRVLEAEFALTTLRPAVAIGLALLVWLVGRELSAIAGMLIMCTATLTVVGFSVIRIRTHTRATVPTGTKRIPQHALPWLQTAIPFISIAGSVELSRFIGTLMIGTMMDTREAGIYGAMNQVTNVLLIGVMSINVMVAPRISEFHSTQRHTELRRMVALAARAATGLSLLTSLAMILLGKWVLSLFGPAFVAGYIPLLIILGGQIMRSICGPVELLNTMTGREWTAFKAISFGAVLNLTLCYFLIPHFGMVGAAIGTASSLVTWNIWLSVSVMRQLHINPTIFARSKKVAT